MRLGETLRRLDRLQQSLGFKIAASAVVVGLMLFGFGAVALDAIGSREAVEERLAQVEAAQEQEADGRESLARAGDDASALAAVQRIAEQQDNPTGRAFAIGAGGFVALVIVWLGLALTYLGIGLIAGGVVVPLWLFESTRSFALIGAGVLALSASFTALMQFLRLAFSGPGPVFAIARNVLAEAVRLKLSLLFIVLLVFALAALPGLLDGERQLRFRIQSFLQYGTGGAFWIIALLTLLFSVATVAFEQRDKLIWQTVTKPVSPAKYIFGKWLGVAGLNAVLLAVCASGVFLFVEYLRVQPAAGEIRAFEPASTGVLISEDRLKLETEVLSARVTAEPEPPFRMDDPGFRESLREYIESRRRIEPGFAQTDAEFEEVVRDTFRSATVHAMTLEPPIITPTGAQAVPRYFRFENLDGARRSTRPVTIRFKVNSDENNPTHFYDIEFLFMGSSGPFSTHRKTAAAVTQTMTLPNDIIQANGVLEFYMYNHGRDDDRWWETGMQLSGPLYIDENGGLQLLYSVGDYRANFMRVIFVLWLKLAALAMLGICTATFLSFPVATLVAGVIFLSAEAAGFLAGSLESYRIRDHDGNLIWWKYVAEQIALVISDFFRIYASLRPTSRLVDGRLLSLGDTALGLVVLALFTLIVYAVAVLIFRRRELAIYSGQ